MESRKTIFGIQKSAVQLVHRIMLFSILYSSFIAPSQAMIIGYFSYKAPLLYKGSASVTTIIPEKNTLDQSSNAIFQKHGNVSKANTFSKHIFSVNKEEITNYYINSDLKEGTIGISKEHPLDDVGDNLFKFSIPSLPQTQTKVYLSYELYGVQDLSAVSRSINERLATGGYLVKQQSEWTPQKEEINDNWLHLGENKILFSIPKGANYQYKVRNVKIVFEPIKENVLLPSLVVNTPTIPFIKNEQLYVKGFLRTSASKDIKVYLENETITYKDGEFEGFLKLTSAQKNRKFVVLKAVDSNGLLGQELITFNQLNEADHLFTMEPTLEATSSIFKANQGGTLQTYDARLTIKDSTLVEDKEIQIIPLRNIDIAPLGAGMVNVTKGGLGYRFLPDGTQFCKPVKIQLAYDEKLLPTGYTAKDIQTFYFNTQSKNWVVVERDTLNESEKMITALTNHFTDYINGIIQSPKSPETASFSSTMMNDIKAADPSAEMTLISPPEPSQKGDANVSYPIKIPAGRKGMQPQLAIQYSNEGSNGILGQGWSMNLPAISLDTRWGTPLLDPLHETEIYMLNGEQLMYPKIQNKSGDMVDWMPNRHFDESSSEAIYSTESRSRLSGSADVFTLRKQGSFTKIERLGNSPSNYYWKVTDTNGTVYWYGGDIEGVRANAVIRQTSSSNSNIVHWGLYMTEDIFKNNVKYTYTNTYLQNQTDDNANLNDGKIFQINTIYYTGFNGANGNYDVHFEYDNTIRKDVTISARLGLKQIDPYFLNSIVIGKIDREGNHDNIRKYTFEMGTGVFKKGRLKAITEWDGSDNKFYTHTFSYYDDIDNKGLFTGSTHVNVPNFDADFTLGFGNRPDVKASRINTSETKEFSWEVSPSIGIQIGYIDNSQKHMFTVNFPFGESYNKNYGKITMADMDGNGLDDVVYKEGHSLYYFPHYRNETTNVDYYSPNHIKIGQVNNFSKTSGKTKSMALECFDFYFRRFHAGKRRFKTKEETSIYVTDGNGDGLPDIVSNATVYFNNGVTTAPDNSLHTEFSTSSQSTPNMLITARPTLITPDEVPDQDPDTAAQEFNYNYDVVRVWQAPYNMMIKINDNVQFHPTTSSSKAVYSIEMLYKNQIQNPGRIYLNTFNNTTPAAININHYNSYPGISLGIQNAASITVDKGQKIYFRLHKNEAGINDVFDSNPTIEMVTNTNTHLDQNGMNIEKYNYADDYILNESQDMTTYNGVVHITWTPFNVFHPSDDLHYKIIKEIQDAEGQVSQEVIYAVDCHPTDTQPIQIAPTPAIINHTVSSLTAEQVAVFRFVVQSDSNVKWHDYQWKPKFEYVADNSTDSTLSSFIKYPVVKHSIYEQFGINEYTLQDGINSHGNSWPLLPSSTSYKIIPNTFIPNNIPTALNLNATDNGSFIFVVKKDGLLLGKRVVKITSGTISFDGDNTPITFFTGIVDTQNPPKISCEFYASGETNVALFKKYTAAVSYDPSPYPTAANTIIANGDEWDDNVATPNFQLSDYSHFWRMNNDVLHDNNQYLGDMYRGWGQFLYNDDFDNSGTMLSDTIGKLINHTIVDNYNANAVAYLTNVTGFDPAVCNNEDSTQHITNCVTSHIPQPTSEGTAIGENNVEGIVEGYNNSQLTSNINQQFYCLLSMHALREHNQENIESEKWTGLFDTQYSKATEMKDGDMTNSEMDNAFDNPGNPSEEESPALVADMHTGMSAITKVQNSSAKSYQAGWGPFTYAKSKPGYSATNSDFIDVNGDRYPDILTSIKIQPTNMTGGHLLPITNFGTNPIFTNDSRNSSLSVSGQFPISGRKKVEEKANDTGKSSYTANLGLTANLSGENEERSTLVDLNGDGLPDRIRNTANGFRYQLNEGRSFLSMPDDGFPLYESFKTKPNSLDASFGSSFGSDLGNNMSFSISMGRSQTGGNVESSLQDINGDGLVDLLKFNNNSGTVQYNLGSKFSDETESLSMATPGATLMGNDKNSAISLTGSFSYYFGFSICCYFIPIVYIKFGAALSGTADLTIAENNKQFKDFDGDGHPDYVTKNGTDLEVHYSRIGRTDMLQTVTNPLNGSFTLDYKAQPVSYDNPNAKWAMTGLRISDGYDKTNDGRDYISKEFVYANGKYDRREREFYGYETVKTLDYTLDSNDKNQSVYRTTVSKYYNDSYFFNGLLKESYVLKGTDENQKFSRTENIYEIKALDNTNNALVSPQVNLPHNFDVGGTEGRRSAAVFLTRTNNYLYELHPEVQLTTGVAMEYDAKGRVIHYINYGNDNNYNDDYNSVITYHEETPLVNKNILNVPETITVYLGDDSGGGMKRQRLTEVDTVTGSIKKIKASLDFNSIYAETDMGYDQYGNMTSITYPENDNPNSALQRMFYRYVYDGIEHKYIVKIIDAFGYFSTAKYNYLFDKVLETTDIANNKMIYEYDSFGRTTMIKAPKEQASNAPYTLKFQYFPFLNLLPSDIANGVNNNFVPVALTQHFDQQHPENPIETYSFIDGFARPMQVKKDISYNIGTIKEPNIIEALSITGKTTYDEFGRTVKQYHPYYEPKEDIARFKLYDGTDNLYNTTSLYDELDRSVKTIDPAGNQSYTSYDITAESGDTALKTKFIVDQNDTQQTITESYKDVNGKVIATKNVGGTSGEIWTRFNYNAIGELLSYTDDQAITTEYSYDNLGRKTSVNHPDNGRTSFEYDKAGNLTQLQTAKLAADSSLNASDRFIKYAYEFNRLTSIMYPNTDMGENISNVTYQYGDPALTGTEINNRARLIKQTDATGEQLFSYGNMGEITKTVRTVVGPSMPTRMFVTEFSYDSWNRIMSMKYPDNENVTYQYDLGGNLNKMSGYSGGNYNYISRIDYDYYEQRTFLKYGNGTETQYTYSPDLRRLSNLKATTLGQGDLFNNNYKYDKIGNVTSIMNNAPYTLNNMGGTYGHEFEYDRLNRLINAKGYFSGNTIQEANNNDFSGDYTLKMAYNNTHGIVSKNQSHIKNGGHFAPNSFNNEYLYTAGKHQAYKIVDTNNSSTTVFKYDENGNLTQKTQSDTTSDLYWDESNRLRVVSKDNRTLQHSFYDASGERVIKATSDYQNPYSNGTITNPSDIHFGSNTTYPNPYIVVSSDGTYSKHYYAGDQRIVSRIGDQDLSIFNPENLDNRPAPPETASPLIYFYHPDHLGTSTFLTDINGKAYQFFLNLPFGETMAEQLPTGTVSYKTQYKFNGKELDEETGLYYYGARYFDPHTSIWLSVDPKFQDYPNWNPYNYCFQNPINLIDPDGMGPTPFPKNKLGSADYYKWRYNDFIKQNPGKKAPDYYLNYGNKYIQRFTNETNNQLSKQGKQWLVQARKNLQVAIEDKLKIDPTIESRNGGKDFHKFAFDSHVDAYWNAGLYKLNTVDLVAIVLTPNFKDLTSADGIKQATEMMAKLADYWLDNPIEGLKRGAELLANKNKIEAMVLEKAAKEGIDPDKAMPILDKIIEKIPIIKTN